MSTIELWHTQPASERLDYKTGQLAGPGSKLVVERLAGCSEQVVLERTGPTSLQVVRCEPIRQAPTSPSPHNSKAKPVERRTPTLAQLQARYGI